MHFPITAIFASSLLVSAPATAKPFCHSPADIAALQQRQLQVESMVATLKCSGEDLDFRGLYGAYVSRQSATLSKNAKYLREMFARNGKGEEAMDHFLTALSNDAQIRSMSNDTYCEDNAQVMKGAASLKPADLPGFAALTIGKPYGVNPCPVADVQKKKGKH